MGNIKRLLFLIGIFFLFFILFLPHSAKASSNTIQINEVYYDVGTGKGTESEGEWVELYNAGTGAINLKNWTIEDNSSSDLLSAIDLLVDPKDFVLIAKNNSVWSFWQIDPNNLPSGLHLIELNSNLGNGLGNSGDILTLIDENNLPVDQISWGDNKTVFDIPTVSEGHSLERVILGSDTDTATDFIDRTSPTPGQEYIKQIYSDDLKISELVPEPADGAENEFVEIYNSGNIDLDISGWQIKDEKGSTKTYTFPIGTFIETQGYLAFQKNLTGLTLNDDGDGVVLLDPSGDIKDERSYDKSNRGQSYSLFSNGWSWSETLTPNAENVLSNTIILSEIGETGGESAGTINEAKNGDNGEEVTVTGQVMTLPGEISSQYFFIQDESGGVQIYSYYKNFPELKRGDKIRVTGELSDYYGTRRIKLAKSQMIEILESSSPPPPIEIAISETGENYESRYVKIQGRISYTSGSIFRITDGNREIQVEIKTGTGIKKPKMRKGDLVEIAGILVQYKNSYRLLPFLQEDVRIIQSNSATLPEAGSNEFASLIITIIIFVLWNIFRTVKPRLMKLLQRSPNN